MPGARTDRRRQPAQILPLFAMMLLALILFGGLIVDLGMAYQAHRDAEVVAWYAAREGAQDLDFSAFERRCTVAFRKAGGDCTRFIAVAGAGRAASTAKAWLDESANQHLSMPTSDRRVSVSTSGPDITVSVSECYQALIVGAFLQAAGGCPSGSWAIHASVTVRAWGAN